MADPEKTCGKDSGYELLEDYDRIFSVRHNIFSIYSRVSTGFVLAVMIGLGLLTTIYVPYYLKEFSIPAILRVTNDNMFYSTMRIRTLTFFSFLICAGCLPHLAFYEVRGKCLYTSHPDPFGLVWTDRYFYALVSLLWFVTVPFMMYYVTTVNKDTSRFLFIPFMVAGIVFSLMIVAFGLIVIIFALFASNDVLT
jgi:hypothetical protein